MCKTKLIKTGLEPDSRKNLFPLKIIIITIDDIFSSKSSFPVMKSKLSNVAKLRKLGIHGYFREIQGWVFFLSAWKLMFVLILYDSTHCSCFLSDHGLFRVQADYSCSSKLWMCFYVVVLKSSAVICDVLRCRMCLDFHFYLM